jgi:hypothetical protein
MARAVVTEVEGRFATYGLGRVVLEWPQVYRTGRGKGDPNDLLALAGVDSAIAALLLRQLGEVSVDYVLPQAWKGTLDGDVLVRRVQERVTPEERARVWLPSAESLHHNVWDAVGLALWSVGRMAKRRVVGRS